MISDGLEHAPITGEPDLTAQTKTLRVSIDSNIKEAQHLATLIARGTGGRNVALCITHLEDAKMRLGMALGDFGHKLPEEYRDESS